MVSIAILFILALNTLLFFAFSLVFFSLGNFFLFVNFFLYFLLNLILIYAIKKKYYTPLKSITCAYEQAEQKKAKGGEFEDIIKLLLNRVYEKKIYNGNNIDRIKELESISKNLEMNFKLKTKELQERINELERFHKLSIGRELKIVELKKLLNNKQTI